MIKILDSAKLSAEAVFQRNNPCANVEDTVTAIIEDVKQNGDEALLRYCKKFDKADLSSLLVSKEEMDAAAESFVAKLATLAPKAEDKSSGCGSVAGIGGVFALLGVCAFVVACKKKED